MKCAVEGVAVSFPNTSFACSSRSGRGPKLLTRSDVLARTICPDPYQNTWFCTNGPPRPNDVTQRSVVLRMLERESATNAAGIASNRAPPESWLVPERVTAFATNPEDRPNSAVIPALLTLNSMMSNSLTSVLSVPKPGLVMLTPSSRYVLSCRLPPAFGPTVE